MNQVRVRSVSPPERRKLHRLKRQRTNQVNSMHARVILLSSGGVKNRMIAEYVGCTPQWVRMLIHRFNRHGLSGVEWYPHWQVRDTPRKFVADLAEQIAEVALSSPQVLIGMTQWSLEKLRQYLMQQRIVPAISLEWLRTLLRRMGIRWRHTQTWKQSSDPDFWRKYRRIRRLYQHRPVGGRRICVDEFGPLNLQPRGGMCLAKGGRKSVTRHRANYHRFGGVRHFLAAYDLETGHLYGRFTSHKTHQEWLSFLRMIRRRVPRGETIYMILDNYRTHLHSEVLAWAKSHRIRFYWLPTNASWLNRIECQFTALKKFTLDNSDYQTHEEQEVAIKSYLAWRNGRREIAIEPWRQQKRTHSSASHHQRSPALAA